MLKKVLLASAIAAVTSGVAYANTVPAPYVGASIGIVNNSVNTKANGFNSGSYRGVPVNLFAGYGGVVNQNFYLAGEVFGTVGTANISDNSALKSSYGVGASIIPGLMITDHTLAYARAGIVKTRFSQNNNSRTGGQFGLGMQTSLTQCVDLRGEYDFVAYQSKSQTVNGVSSSVAPRSDQFSVGLVYKID